MSSKFQHGCSIAEKHVWIIFFITLDSPSQKRYNEKIELIENKDPYTLSENEFSVDYDNLPSIYSL